MFLLHQLGFRSIRDAAAGGRLVLTQGGEKNLRKNKK